MQNGQLTGQFTKYYEDGNVSHECNYNNNTFVKIICYDKNGNVCGTAQN